MRRDKKIKIVEELKEKSGRARSLVLTDYRGLTHRQMEEIKKALKEVGADFMVTKNTLLKLALTNSQLLNSISNLEGPTATLFSYQDEIAPLSTLAKFIKNFGLPQIKMGILGEKVLSNEEILRLAFLPPREVLLTNLVRCLKSPLQRTTYALSFNIQKLDLILKGVRKNG